MQQKISRLLAHCAALTAAALTAAAMAPQAFAATVIDFESPDLTGVYGPGIGDSFALAGFSFTVARDFGTIDTAASFASGAPTGNATQFYFNSNDALLSMVDTAGASFSFNGFSAAFVPLDPESAQTTVIVARGTKADTTSGSAVVTRFWSFAPSATSNHPFASYAAAADFAAFSSLKQLDFYACSLVAGVACTQPTLNNGQFALDDIVVNVTAVPEPASALLLALGLAGLGLRARRAR